MKNNNCIDYKKLVIIGCGFVGSACAFNLMLSGLFNEIVMIDKDIEKAQGEALDISHGLAYTKPMKIHAGNYDDVENASIIIITAGANQKKDETRLDLASKNIKIYKNILDEINKRNFNGILLVVSNPVDILTTIATKYSKLPENKIIGSGTLLDTARLKYEIGRLLNIDLKSVHAFIIGEHGDSEIAVFSSANVAGIKLSDFCKQIGLTNHHQTTKIIEEKVKNSAYEIISKKDATYFGIAVAVKRICEAIVRDEKSILPLSTMLHGEYGISGIAISVPVIVGKNGVEGCVPITINEEEQQKLNFSAQIIKKTLDKFE